MIDVLLLLMAVFWGTNYAIVKTAFREIEPQAFNALRMSVASLIFLTALAAVRLRARWSPERIARDGPLGTVFARPTTERLAMDVTAVCVDVSAINAGDVSLQAAVLLANMQSHEAATELSAGLQQALRSRDMIATAKGILMARDGLDEDSAFALLISVSQREHTKLRDVAQAIVSSTTRRRR